MPKPPRAHMRCHVCKVHFEDYLDVSLASFSTSKPRLTPRRPGTLPTPSSSPCSARTSPGDRQLKLSRSLKASQLRPTRGVFLSADDRPRLEKKASFRRRRESKVFILPRLEEKNKPALSPVTVEETYGKETHSDFSSQSFNFFTEKGAFANI